MVFMVFVIFIVASYVMAFTVIAFIVMASLAFTIKEMANSKEASFLALMVVAFIISSFIMEGNSDITFSVEIIMGVIDVSKTVYSRPLGCIIIIVVNEIVVIAKDQSQKINFLMVYYCYSEIS